MKLAKELISILKMQQDDPVAIALLDLRYEENVVNKMGYLGIAYDNPSLLSYITEDRFKKFEIKRERVEEQYFYHHNEGDKLKTNETSLISENGKSYHIKKGQTATITYVYGSGTKVAVKLRVGKDWYQFASCGSQRFQGFEPKVVTYTESNYFDKQLRISNAYMAKAGKVINKLFGKDRFTKREVETFATIFYSNNNPLGYMGKKFKVVKGNEIARHYHYSMVDETSNGSLGASCMRHDKCQQFFDIYTKNDNVSMLVLLNKYDRVIGRALLWSDMTLSGTPDIKFMDRIYTCDSKDTDVFIKWAIDNKYAYKRSQSATTYDIMHDGKRFDYTAAEVTLKNHTADLYPYIDTFHYYEPETGKFLTETAADGRMVYRMSGYQTGRLGDLHRLGGSLSSDDINESQWSEWHQEYYDDDDLVWSECVDSYILSDIAVRSVALSDYIPEGEEIHLSNGNIWYNGYEGDDFHYHAGTGECHSVDDCMLYNGVVYLNEELDLCIIDYDEHPKTIMTETPHGMVANKNMAIYNINVENGNYSKQLEIPLVIERTSIAEEEADLAPVFRDVDPGSSIIWRAPSSATTSTSSVTLPPSPPRDLTQPF